MKVLHLAYDRRTARDFLVPHRRLMQGQGIEIGILVGHCPKDVELSEGIVGTVKGCSPWAWSCAARRAVKEFKADLVVVHMLKLGAMAPFWRAFSRDGQPIRRVYFSHGTAMASHSPFKKTAGFLLETAASYGNDEIIYLNDACMKLYDGLNLWRNQAQTKLPPPPGVDEALHGARPSAGSSKPLTFAHVGRACSHKGLGHLLGIWSRSERLRKEAKLVVYGVSPFEWNRIAPAFDLHNVEFKGFEADRRRIYSSFDVLCLFSEYEGSPMVVQEAAMAGIPTLATDVQGTNELVTNGKNGWLVGYGDWDAAQARMESFLDNQRIVRHAAAAASEMAGRFGASKVAQAYAGFYRSRLPAETGHGAAH